MPKQPGIHRAKGELSLTSEPSSPFDMLKDPTHFRATEVSIQDKACLFLDQGCQTLGSEFITKRSGPTILPDNGWTNGFASLTVPGDGGLTLIGDTNGRDVLRLEARFADGGLGNLKLCLPNLIGIMFHPTWFGINLCEFLLSYSPDARLTVEDDGSGTGGALIECQNGFHDDVLC
jgi:hypothetical protein